MFDLAADDGSVRRKPFQSPIPQSQDGEPGQIAPEKLDSEKMDELHTRMLALYTHELDRQRENRLQMALDEAFYDNEQWDPNDAAELEARGQKPIVYNVISATVDWVTGTEKRARADFKILPRRKTEGKPAERKTQLLKYLSDVNRTPFHVSRAFEDAVKAGLGWVEDAIHDEDEEEPIYSRYENWRNMLWDSAATELDLKDARYVFRSKWVDLDVAVSIFRKRRGTLDAAASDSDDFLSLDAYGDEAMDSQELELDALSLHSSDQVHGYHRRRVRLVEAWIRLPVETQRMIGGSFAGEIYDQWSVAHREELASGKAQTRKKVAMRMHVVIFTTTGLLWFSESPYRHNTFPFTPIWGKRRAKDGMPYGIIRGLRGMQEDINKRASKALAILSNNKVIMDDGAVDDLDEFAEEIAKPNAIIVKKPGKEITIDADRELSQWQLELMGRNIQMVQQASGVTDELLGRRTNATSGIAIQRRQDQGSMATAKYFDNLRFAAQVRGEKQLALVEQFVTEEKAFRITNMRGSPEYVTVNDGDPDNDIVRSKADYVISEADWRATIRQAAVDELMEVMTRLPAEVSMVLLDLVVENMDIPNRDEIVKRIRAITNQRDPDQDEPSEEEIARDQANAQASQLDAMMLMATLREKMGKAAKLEVEAQALAEKLVAGRVATQKDALGAAREALSAPAVAHTADHILAESGFVSESDRQAQQAEAMQPEAAMAQQAQAQQPGIMPGMPA